MSVSCSFCHRHQNDCPAGLWHRHFGRARQPGDAAICVGCARTAIRGFGEQPDPKPVEPVSIFSRRMGLLRTTARDGIDR